MSRGAFLVIAGLLALSAALLGLRRAAPQTPEAERTVEAQGPALSGLPGAAPTSETERARIREFWKVYRQATGEKQAGQWRAAVQDYRRALEFSPDHWDSLYYLGNALMELGRYPEARAAYDRLAAADNQAARGHSALGALYANPNAGPLFNLRRAESEYALARSANADESGSVLRLGEVALAAGETARARDYLEAAGRTNFRSVHARFLQGYLAWSGGDRTRARDLFREAVGLTAAQKPPAGVLGEGDTRLPGYRAMTLPGQHGLFDPFVAELWKNRDGGEARMTALYAQVRDFLKSLPRR